MLKVRKSGKFEATFLSTLSISITNTKIRQELTHTCQQEEMQDFTTYKRIRAIKGEDAWFAHVSSCQSATLVWLIYNITSAEQNIVWHTSIGSLA